MNIAIAADSKFGDHEAFMEFMGMHSLAHRGIARVMSAQGMASRAGLMWDESIAPIDWMLDHYDVHTLIGRELGLPVQDLVGYDLSVLEQYTIWMRIHGDMHSAINLALGITS